jgi:hypothetical protein
VTEARSEKIHRLLVEVMHGNLWKNNKTAKYGLCWSSLPAVEKEPEIHDYDILQDFCPFCFGRSQGTMCPIEWGFLIDYPGKLKRTTIMRFGHGPYFYINTGACYDPHFNLISIDGSPPFNKGLDRRIERIISHETLHWVLLKLLPRSNAYRQFDNIAKRLDSCFKPAS